VFESILFGIRIKVYFSTRKKYRWTAVNLVFGSIGRNTVRDLSKQI
jgi:hypothetical protein